METSLARQLKLLAVPQTSSIEYDKVKPSLLFDPKDAASYPRDTFRKIGSNGLDKLLLKEPKFAEFHENLFSESSESFDRAVQTKEANKALNKTIGRFFHLLVPYFAAREAHEASEWLIHRFHVHLYNVDEVMACILPHHNTRIFVRFVQLFNLSKTGNQWYWLQQVQVSRVPLTSAVIKKQFISDRNFRHFVCNMIVNILKDYKDNADRVLKTIAFSTLTVYGALSTCKKIDDHLIAVLLPFIKNGLESRIPSYCAGAYLIISALIMKTTLCLSLLQKWLSMITQNLFSDMQSRGLEVLVMMFEYQSINVLHEKSILISLLSHDNIVYDLEQVLELKAGKKFMHAILKMAIQLLFEHEIASSSPKRGDVMLFTEDLIKSVDMEQSSVTLLVRLILKRYTKMHTNHRTEQRKLAKLNKVGSSLLKCVEMRFGDYFDSALKLYFEKNLKKDSEITKEFVKNSVVSFRHEMVPCSTDTFFIGINHHNDVVRSVTVDLFLDRIVNSQNLDEEFVKTSLIARINDDCPDIVLKILSSEKALKNSISEEELLESLQVVLNRNVPEKLGGKWNLVKEEALKMYCNVHKPCVENIMQLKLLSVVLPFFLPLKYEALKYTKCVLDSQLGDHHPIFRVVKENCFLDIIQIKESNKDMLFNLLLKIVDSLLTAVGSMEQKIRAEMVHYLINNKPDLNKGCPYYFILQLILQQAIEVERDVEQRMNFAREAMKLCSFCLSSKQMSTSSEVPKELRETVITSVKILRRNEFPSSVIFYLMQSVIKSLKVECNSRDDGWWPDLQEEKNQSPYYQLSVEIFEFLCGFINLPNSLVSSGCKMLLGLMMKHYLGNYQKIFWFLSSILSKNDKLNIHMQMAAISVAGAFCVPSDNHLNWIFDDNATEIPSLLSAISSPSEKVRSCALRLFNSILASSKKCSHPLRALVTEICNHHKEIVMDPNQMYQVIDHWLAPAYTPGSYAEIQGAVFKWLLNLVTDARTPSQIRHQVLLTLQFVDSVGVLEKLLPVLKEFLDKFKDNMVQSSPTVLAIIQLLLKKFTEKTACSLVDERSEAFKVLSLALQMTVQRMNVLDVTVHEMAMQCVTKDFFVSIPSPVVQQKILGMFVNLCLKVGDSEPFSKIGKSLKKICIDAPMLSNELHAYASASPQKTERPKKKLRTMRDSTISEASVWESLRWKKIIVLLEAIQMKKKINHKELLIPQLFTLLSSTLEWENQFAVDSVRQLIISSILNCCGSLESVNEGQFQVELVIQCMRVSDSPQTHHKALELLNLAAKHFPDRVMNNIMSLFTFMGTTFVRQDSSYSFQVIDKTIETIIPALLQTSHQQKEEDSLQVISSVIRVFIDALLDIPRHRWIPLFTKLTTTLGPLDYLWLPFVQICESFIAKYSSPSEFVKYAQDLGNHPYFEFILDLYGEYHPAVQINTFTHLMKFLATLPDSKEKVVKIAARSNVKAPVEPFDISIHTEFQLQSYKYLILLTMNKLLCSKSFIRQISELDDKMITSMESKYEELIEVTLQNLQYLSQPSLIESNGSLLLKSYELLNNVNSLLPCVLFIDVTRNLLKNPATLVRRKTLEMLNAKLENQYSFFVYDNYEHLLKLLRPLLRIVKRKKCDATEGSEDLLQNRQNALVSLHLLCKLIGKEYPQEFYKVLGAIVKVLMTDSSQSVLAINTLVCLAQLCSILKEEVVPRLNSFMPCVVNMLENIPELRSNECLALGAVAALQGLFEYLGNFLSGYVQPIVKQVCLLNSIYMGSKNSKNNLPLKFEKLCQLISSKIPARVLVPAISKCYRQILKEDKSSVGLLMSILKVRFSSIDLLDLQSQLSEAQTFYLFALDFRFLNDMEPLSLIESIEGDIISSLITFSKKLSESAFRGFFHNIYQWTIKTEEKQDRFLTFYRLTHELSDALKDIFVLFAGHFYRNAASILDSNNVMKTDKAFFGDGELSTLKSSQLLNFILDTLSNCFRYDSSGFMDKDSFNFLMQPLVDQIENEQGDAEAYQERISNHLKTCIGLFSLSVSDNALWKSVNYQILLKTRHSSPKVKFAALEVIEELVKKMGSEYLVLLAESIPFLSELMEDENLEVERKCQSVIAMMEEVLGEPVTTYL